MWIAPAVLVCILVPSEKDREAGLDSITKDEVEAHLRYLASPTLEGRDSPSRGLMLAAEHGAAVFREAGLVEAPGSAERYAARKGDLPGLEDIAEPPAWSVPPARPSSRSDEEGDAGTYLWPFEADRLGRGGSLNRPQPERCKLVVFGPGDDVEYVYGEDFIPFAGQPGSAEGELAWVGFGIKSRKLKYDAVGPDLDGKIAVLLSGDPRGVKTFEKEELTAEASIYNKLKVIEDAGAVGAIVVRRLPAKPDWMKEDLIPPPLGYRYTWASWNPPSTDRNRGTRIPVIEVSEDCASRLIGKDVGKLAAALDKSSKPKRVKLDEIVVSLRASEERAELTLPNLVGVLPGSDPVLKDEYVVVGAHMDHIGVGPRNRMGLGADDNASGTSALLEIVQAAAIAKPRRSILFCLFSAEEDGLLGSAHIANNLPVEKDKVVAMINLDMIGRGPTKEVYCLGFQHCRGMEKVVDRAQDLGGTGVKRIRRCDDEGIFQRSDHYSFFRVNLPVVFFFENFPISKNEDYHTWRDTFDKVDLDKVTHTARLAFHTAWILATDDERLPSPRR